MLTRWSWKVSVEKYLKIPGQCHFRMTASAKALRQEQVWLVQEKSREPVQQMRASTGKSDGEGVMECQDGGDQLVQGCEDQGRCSRFCSKSERQSQGDF